MNLVFHIEDLVPRSFAPSNCCIIASAVETELVCLFTQQGAQTPLVNGRGMTHLDAGSFEVAPGSREQDIDAWVVQALYGGLKR